MHVQVVLISWMYMMINTRLEMMCRLAEGYFKNPESYAGLSSVVAMIRQSGATSAAEFRDKITKELEND